MIKHIFDRLFKIHSPSKEMFSKYVEVDTECDKCEFLFSCEGCIESTRTIDSRRHYVRDIGGECRKDYVINELNNIGMVNAVDSETLCAALNVKEEQNND